MANPTILMYDPQSEQHYPVELIPLGDGNYAIAVSGSGSGGADTQYADGATQATPTGNAVLWKDGANVLHVPSPANPLPIAGNAASGSADAGSPVKVGGVYNSSAPTLTSGQRGDLQLDANGNLKVNQGTLSSVNDSVAALGNVASLAADSGNPVKVGAVYNSTAPAPTTGQRVDLQADSQGRLQTAPPPSRLAQVPLATTANTYAAGNAIGSAALSLTGMTRINNGTAIIESVCVVDAAHQNAALDLLLFTAPPTTAPADKTAYSLSTADLATLIGKISVPASAYTTYGNMSIGMVTGLNVIVQTASASTTIYAVAVSQGTPTYTANCVEVSFGVIRD